MEHDISSVECQARIKLDLLEEDDNNDDDQSNQQQNNITQKTQVIQNVIKGRTNTNQVNDVLVTINANTPNEIIT